MSLEQKILAELAAQFPSHSFAPESLRVQHRGRMANALVFRYYDTEYDLTIKDFRPCPWIVGQTFGRICIGKEFRSMDVLQDLPCVTPMVRRLSPRTVAYSYIPGKPLNALHKESSPLPEAFFQRMEEMVAAMHARGIVHLDLRNMGNILCGDDGQPYFIDFQSSMRLKWVPRPLRGLIQGADISAVYKAWNRLGATPLPPEKKDYLEEFNRIRKFWVLKGYPLSHLWARLRNKPRPPRPSAEEN